MTLKQIIEPLAEGFFGALRLFVAIVAAPWGVVKAFVGRSPHSGLGRAHR
jgi:hypothetical protein